jgi:hypothetical protein
MTRVVDLMGWLDLFSLSNWIFSQFHPSILGWLKIRLYDLFQFFSMKLSLSHDLGHRFDGLTLVDSGQFFYVLP